LIQETVLRDPRLASHASGPQPAWLWSSDGAQILWANAAGAAALGLRGRGGPEQFGPADPHRRQIAQLAARLPQSGATRLERMSGFGAMLGQLATCSCSRFELDDGTIAILVASLISSARPRPLVERLQFILDGCDGAAVALSADGTLLAINGTANNRAEIIEDMASLPFMRARTSALRDGAAEGSAAATRFTLYRVGSGHETSIVALIAAETAALTAPAADTALVANEGNDDAPLDEAFADEVLVDEDNQEDSSSASDQTVVQTAIPAAPREDTAQSDTMRSADATTPADPPNGTGVEQYPLRFLWQMDADSRFSLGSDEFAKLIGPLAAAALGRPWDEIAERLRIDPDQLVAKAIATRETWSGIVVHWPVNDAAERIPIELSGLPLFDRAQDFVGYRGFGICRDTSALKRLAELRRHEGLFGVTYRPPSPVLEPDTAAPKHDAVDEPPREMAVIPPPPVGAVAKPPTSEPDPAVAEALQNVVPFRPANDPRAPALSALENHAFDEIARRLSARLDQARSDDESDAEASEDGGTHDAATAVAQSRAPGESASPWQGAAELTRGDRAHDKPLLDRVPVGVLIYRLDRLLYANPAFLAQTGFSTLSELSEAGGLDALYVEPLEPSASSSSESGMPLSIATGKPGETPTMARLYSISWDGEPAMALIFASEAVAPVAEPQRREPAAEPVAVAATPPQPPGDDLAPIIDAITDAIVVFDGQGNIVSCNRGASGLFNSSAEQLRQRHLGDLFAPESQPAVLAYIDGLEDADVAGPVDHGREVLGQTAAGKRVPLMMTMGRAGAGKLFAVFRDLSHLKQNEAELQSARRSAAQAAASKADVLAKISHEIRMPLNAIIGFAEAMLEQRLGPLGADRYLDYMRDIRAAGARVLAIVGDMLDLSRIETGRLELSLADVNLNTLVAQCVGELQPEANRERIIIRSSLAHHLPIVHADTATLRQIVSNMIASSIHLANAGGQVIVSTALTDDGEVALRVRDSGKGLSDGDLAAAVEPYRTSGTDDHVVPDTASVNLSLTKALVEANRAQFRIRKAAQSGTLIEVIFKISVQAAAG
jgi:PAS domain S-box-containing protein